MIQFCQSFAHIYQKKSTYFLYIQRFGGVAYTLNTDHEKEKETHRLKKIGEDTDSTECMTISGDLGEGRILHAQIVTLGVRLTNILEFNM